MRGPNDVTGAMFFYFDPDSRIPADHPLRSVKRYTDSVLAELSAEMSKAYSPIGRPSVPPERLLKGMLLTALYSVRSDRMFCEMLEYNMLFRWFLDMDLDEKTFNASSFSRLRSRLLETDVTQRFFDLVLKRAKEKDLLSAEHFTVDGTLIEAWASHKSFVPKNEATAVQDPPATTAEVTADAASVEPPGGVSDDTAPQSSMDQDAAPLTDGPAIDGAWSHSSKGPAKDEMIDFRGQKRTNDTHQSTTDPEARLLRKGRGKEAKLCFGGHALMENRNGLLIDLQVALATATEPELAKVLIARAKELGLDPKTLGADKGYHTKDFVKYLREVGIAPHIARIEGRRTPGLDGRTTRHEGYKISQRVRKRVEEIFGWGKSYGGLRKTRFKGVKRNQFGTYLVGAAYNLMRLSRLAPI